MERVLQGLRWQVPLVCLDVTTCSHSILNHSERLRVVFSKFTEAGFKLKPKKCHFFQREVVNLGHVVVQAGISTDKLKSKHWPIP